ncbi:general odorant-binding protein 68-like [Battus philenor]|uniref:general odorant-binding protein 68-like n=1 Tax=Battus philenor TaxID=42288 RepID=UPI0035D0DF0F
MLVHSTLLIFVAAFQLTATQGPPPLPPNLPKECLQPPHVENPRACCKLPVIFTKENFESCGFKENPEGKSKYGPPDCTKQLCLLRTHDLVKEDDQVDQEALIKFIDGWADTYPEFKPPVESAKSKCLGKELPGPPEICEANKIVFCISSVLFMECPVWANEDEGCKNLKNHIDTCSKYFPH